MQHATHRAHETPDIRYECKTLVLMGLGFGLVGPDQIRYDHHF